MKFNFEKRILQMSLLVFVVFFFFGFLLGKGYYQIQKKKMLVLKETQKRAETQKIEKIFAGFPEKKFLQIIKP